MGCRKFRNDLTDAALGSLEPMRAEPFRRHLAGCESCRRAFAERQRLAETMDRSLAEFFSEEPLADFTARVRMRLRAEPAPAERWFAGRLPKVAGALAVFALLAVWWIGRSKAPDANQVPRIAVNAPVRTTPVDAGKRTTELAVSSSLGKKAAMMQATQRRVRPRSPAAAVVTGLSGPLEVLVASGEEVAFRQLYESLRSGRIDARVLAAERSDVSVEMKIEPLQVARLEDTLNPLPDERQR